jgi:uncharacterized protein YodC (DUF2158 family)
MPKFSKGDQVQLKSGGPAMTVASPNALPGGSSSNVLVDVRWFAGSKMESARVDEEALQGYVPPPPKAPK